MDKKSMFRKEALEAIQTQAKLEESVSVIKSKSWIALITVCILVGVGLLWAIFGRIPERVEGQGIMLKAAGNFIIESLEEGIVEKIYVDEGDLVEKDQVLMKLSNPSLVLDLENLVAKKARIEDHRKAFADLEEEKVNTKKVALEASIIKHTEELKRLEKELKAMEEDYYWKEQLYQKGLIALPTLNRVVETINNKKSKIDATHISILDSKAQLKELDKILQFQEFESELKETEAAIAEKKLEIQELVIKSPYKGRILAVSVKEEADVKEGESLIWGEQHIPDEKEMLFYGFFTSAKNQRLKEGMPGEVALREVDDKEYGELMVKAKEVWPFPLSSEDLYKIIGNDQIVSLLTDGGKSSPIQVSFTLLKDNTTPSGYKWTSKQGPPFTITSGLLGNIKVTISSQRPISYLFPFFRELRESTSLSKEVQENKMKKATVRPMKRK